ncbi:MAG: 3-hydroxyacyl-ACP dehydratase FabZ [Candidatus Deferrimicrobiaceae bacterium]
MFTAREIMQLLPHRFPFLLLDRIVELEPGRRVVGLKNVTIDEPFFAGHFPDYPIMPGVLIIEALAQAGGFLALKAMGDEGKIAFFAGIDKCKFRRPVIPGDQLRLECTVIGRKGLVWKMHGEATVDGVLVAVADLTASLALPLNERDLEGAGR